jgi:hypothetical protein
MKTRSARSGTSAEAPGRVPGGAFVGGVSRSSAPSGAYEAGAEHEFEFKTYVGVVQARPEQLA